MSRTTLAAMTLSLAAVAPVSAYEVFPPGLAYYGSTWAPGIGQRGGGEVFYPGPVEYGPTSRTEVFPKGPVHYDARASSSGNIFPPGPAYYDPNLRDNEVFRPGPVGYAPHGWREPYYRFPYPPCGHERTPQAPRWPTCFAQEWQPRRGGKALPQRPIRSPIRPPQIQAMLPPVSPPQAPIIASPAPAAGLSTDRLGAVPPAQQDVYQYQGGVMISGPPGFAYHVFGVRPPFGTLYERHGNMLYGIGSRCRLFGNTALCW
jgi:hypothetical protein